MANEKKKPGRKPNPDKAVSRADLTKLKSELRVEMREGFHKIARALNIDYDSIT